jgi:hypothetical protein
MTKEVKAVEEVVEAEFTEVTEAPVEEQGKPIACGFSVIMTEDGDISFHPHGSNPNLVTMDGLLKYAERYLEREWAPRLVQQSAE